MLNVVFVKEVCCHLTSFQSTLMISLKNFDSLVTVYMLVRCLWAASSMPMILCCFLVAVMVHKNGRYAAIMVIDLGYGLIPRRINELSLESVLPLILL